VQPWKKALSPAAAWLCRCVSALDKLKLEGDEQIGVNIVKRALQETVAPDAENAAKRVQSFWAR